MNRFIILLGDTLFNSFLRNIYKDCEMLENVAIEEPISFPNAFFNKLAKIHFSTKLNTLINIPFKSIWYRYLTLNKNYSTDDKYYIVFHNITLRKYYDYKYLSSMKQKYNLVYVLYILDSMSKEANNQTKKFLDLFDQIYTFDQNDAKKYAFDYYSLPYSKLNIKNGIIKYDFFYNGHAMDNDRLHSLLKIYNTLHNHKVVSKFGIVGVDNKDYKMDGISYNEYLNNDEFLSYTLKSNCLLEYLQAGQTGQTGRYYDAVCYNKKLLTNNKNVVNLPFYNPEYMKVFESPEDIDCDWVKERIPVDYGYDGRFSPVHLLDKIVEADQGKQDNQIE